MLYGASEQTFYYAHLKPPSNEAQRISSDPPAFSTPAAPSPLAALPIIVAPPVVVALDPTPKDVDAPHVLGHMTERVQESMDYIKRKSAIGKLTQIQVMAHLIRL